MDETYLKMILALPDEFFKDWEFNDGDQVYLIEEIDEYTCSSEHGLYTVFDGLLANDGFLNTENWLYVRVIDFKNGRPIPSQEQLQGLILTNFLKSDETAKMYDVITFFCGWYQAHYTFYQSHKEVENDSGKSIWLRYAMSVIYNKRWGGETWI